MSLEGRRAVVTGASRGIGAAIARAFDTAGIRTLLVARSAGVLDSLAHSLRHAHALPLDLAETSAAQRVAERAGQVLGGVDVLVNNAGIFGIARIDDTLDETIDRTLALNLAAPFRLMRAFLPSMRLAKRGHLVTIGSVADRTVYGGNAAYAATKFGARALHEAARLELRGTGVRSTLVSPGPTDTPLWDAHDPDNREGFTPRAAMLQPEQVADAVMWAVSRDDSVNVDELRLSHA